MVFPLFCFGPLPYWQELLKTNSLEFEVCEHFPKQTYRNRFELLTAQGRFSVTIPLANKSSKAETRAIVIDRDDSWQRKLLRTLDAAYNLSPFYEHYKPQFEHLFSEEEEKLINFNLRALKWCCHVLGISFQYTLTNHFKKESQQNEWFREKPFYKKAKDLTIPFQTYPQVFEDRFGFVPHLSILDLLFNEGPNAISYLGK